MFSSKMYNGLLFNDHASKESIYDIRDTIIHLGYDCEFFGGVNELIRLYNNSNKDTYKQSIFINLSDGLTQKYSRLQVPVLCDLLELNYSGSEPLTVALMNNKHYCKKFISQTGCHIPDGFIVQGVIVEEYFDKIKFPIIVKPNCEGSSVGITKQSVCYDKQTAINLTERLMTEFQEVLIEEFIPGYEITNLLVGNRNDIRINETILIKYGGSFINNNPFDITLKSTKKYQRFLANEVFDDLLINNIQETSEKIFNIIDAKDISRIDYRLTPNGELYFIEMNSVPRISKTSEVGFVMQKHSKSFADFLKIYIDVITQRLF